jgi:hypothetical protein
MKKILAIILITFVAIPVFAQFKFGIKAGLSTNSIDMKETGNIVGSLGTYNIKGLATTNYGFHGGIFLRLTILKVTFIQPEVLFATSNYTFKIKNVNTNLIDTIGQKLSTLTIPLMVGVKFGAIRINAGPVGNIAIGSPGALVKDDPNMQGLYNKMSIGYQAGLGLDLFKKLTIDVRYEGSLQKYQAQIKQAVGGTVNLDSRPNAFLFSLGYMF